LNWGELKTAVQQYLEAGTPIFVNNLPLYARLAEEDIHRMVQLPVTREVSRSSIAPNDRFVTQPLDFLSAYSLQIVGDDFLLPKDNAFLREAYPDETFLGKPRYYAIHDDQTFIIAPTPDISYLMELSYFKTPPSITVPPEGMADPDNNVTWLSENGEMALIFGTILHGYIFEKGDQDVIQSYKGKFDEAVAMLKQIAEGRQRKDTYRAPDQRIPT